MNGRRGAAGTCGKAGQTVLMDDSSAASRPFGHSLTPISPGCNELVADQVAGATFAWRVRCSRDVDGSARSWPPPAQLMAGVC